MLEKTDDIDYDKIINQLNDPILISALEFDNTNIHIVKKGGNTKEGVFNVIPEKTPIVDGSTEYVDAKREFKNILTDFINDYFLETNDNLHIMLHTVHSIFQKALQKYIDSKSNPNITEKDIIFFYKGGNVLRMQFLQFMKEITECNNCQNIEPFINFMYEIKNRYFKKSDLDFNIYISNKIPNYDIIVNEVTRLSYFIIKEIRRVISQNKSKYFNYYTLNDNKKRELLQKLLDTLNESASITKSKTSHFFGGKFTAVSLDDIMVNTKGGSTIINSGKKDFTIVGVENKYNGYIPYDYKKTNVINDLKHHVVAIKEIYDNNTNTPISVNTALSFVSSYIFNSFNLVRMKQNFVLIFEINNVSSEFSLGGELIDLAIPTKPDSVIDHFFENKNDYVQDYNITLQKYSPITITAFSLQYAIDDLNRILFSQFLFPWSTHKYEKRIYRLFILNTINFMRETIDIEKKCAVINWIHNKIRKLQKIVNPITQKLLNEPLVDIENSKTINIFYTNFVEWLGKINKEFKQLGALDEYKNYHNLIHTIVSIIDKFLEQTKTNQYSNAKELQIYIDMCANIMENMTILCKAVRTIRIKLLSKEESYKQISQYGGNNIATKREQYKYKYNKYKRKYLALKNL